MEVWRTLALLVLFSAGCSTARYVTKDEWGGVVAIPRDTNQWPNYFRKQAEELMQKQCPQGFVIENEGDLVVGEETIVQNGADPASPDYLLGGQVQRVYKRPITEHHICFRAKNTPPGVKKFALQQPAQQTTMIAAIPAPAPDPVKETTVQPVAATGTDLPPAPVPVEK